MPAHHKTPKRRRRAAILAILCLAVPGAAVAHGGASGIVKERMDVMGGLADHMKALKAAIVDGAGARPSAIAERSRELRDHAEMLEELFPEGTDNAPSEVLPVIWEDWDGFTDSADSLATAAADLTAAAEAKDGDRMNAAFKAIGRACSECHRTYREAQ